MGTVKAPDGMPETRLEGLIREHQVSLTRMCYLYLHDEKMAEDAVQETFFKACRSWASYRGEASEKTWLTRIAVNTCKDMLRGHVPAPPDAAFHPSAALFGRTCAVLSLSSHCSYLTCFGPACQGKNPKNRAKTGRRMEEARRSGP